MARIATSPAGPLLGLMLLAAACSSASREPTVSTSVSAPVGVTTTASQPLPAREEDPMPVIVDYSPTASDVTALIYLTQVPDVELLAVTIPTTGESHCEHAVPNTLGVLERVGVVGVPVSCGVAPDHPTNKWPEPWRDAADTLGGMTIPVAEQQTQPAASELLASTIEQSDRPVTLITLGPLTNIARALKERPEIIDRIAEIYVMGGAIEVDGNVEANGVAEWNFYIDPISADRVIRSGAPVTLVPLDATNHVPVRRVWVAALEDNLGTRAAETVYDLITSTGSFELPGFYFWDELAAAVATDQSLVTFEEGNVAVWVDGVSEGMTRLTAAGAPARLAMAADQQRFERQLLARIAGSQIDITSPASPEVTAYFEAIAESWSAADRTLEGLFESFEDLDLEEGRVLSEPEWSELQEVTIVFWNGVLDAMAIHLDTIEGLEPPSTVAEAHRDYVAAASAVLTLRDAISAAVAAAEPGDPGRLIWGLDPPGWQTAVEAVDEACAAMVLEAQRNRLSVDLLCE